MKKFQITTPIAILMAMSLLLTACSGTQRIIDTGVTNEVEYSDYHFWEQENILKLETSFTLQEADSSQEEFEEKIAEELPKKYQKEIQKLQEGISKYFETNYSVDVTEKLQKQQIKLFSVDPKNGARVMGYVEQDDSNVLNLNKLLTTNEYKHLFDNTYVHETLHQLGVMDQEGYMLNEGIADAYTDLILCSMNRESIPTPNYFETRTLGYQIIAVDQELPKLYFGEKEFSLTKRITEKLCDIPKENCKNPGKALETFATILFSNAIGMLRCNTDPYWYAYDAQDIVYQYCKTFEPNHDKIDYIRNHYLVEDFEEVSQ